MNPAEQMASALNPNFRRQPKIVPVMFEIKVKLEVQSDTVLTDQQIQSFTMQVLKGNAHVLLETGKPTIDKPAVQPAKGQVFTVTFDLPIVPANQVPPNPEEGVRP